MFKCRLCGGESLRLLYTQGNADEFKFYRCSDCELVNYDLAGGLSQAKYATEYPDPLDNSLKVNRDQSETARFLASKVPAKGSLLEIGCGNGRLLHLARELGWNVKGLELSQFMADSIVLRLGIPVVCADFLSFNPGPGKYDLVIMRHVLEHLPDPVTAMSSIGRLLNPGGRVLMEFPNIEAWDLEFRRFMRRTGIHRKKYQPDYKPGHCNEYSRKSFSRLLALTGFDLVSWRTYSSKPLADLLYRLLPVGNKARVLARRSHATTP